MAKQMVQSMMDLEMIHVKRLALDLLSIEGWNSANALFLLLLADVLDV